MKSNSQTRFDDSSFKTKLTFGGSLLRKSANRHARPISTKLSMHIILKSSKAKGAYSLRNGKNGLVTERILNEECAAAGVRLIKFSNNFNHLHIHAKFTSRALYLRFIRRLTARLAMAIAKLAKGRSAKSVFGKKGFWDARPFTRIVKGLKAFQTLNNYIRLNQLEAEGLIPKREGRLRDIQDHERKYFDSARAWQPPMRAPASSRL